VGHIGRDEVKERRGEGRTVKEMRRDGETVKEMRRERKQRRKEIRVVFLSMIQENVLHVYTDKPIILKDREGET
jgi:hypothetical protein